MTRTTPPRPLDVEALFPELAAYRGTTTRLHPRPGSPDVSVSSIGGPMLWPADEPWPLCSEAHGRGRGRRPADFHLEREVLASAWAREPFGELTDEEAQLTDELGREHRIPGASETDPLPLIGLAQLYRRDTPDLSTGPDGCDLLQVFWCPFDAHGVGRYGMLLHLVWRKSADVGEVLASPPQPQVVGYDGYVPEPCVLYPEQVATPPSPVSSPRNCAPGSTPGRRRRRTSRAKRVPSRSATSTTCPSHPAGGSADSPPGTPPTRSRWTAAPVRRRCNSC